MVRPVESSALVLVVGLAVMLTAGVARAQASDFAALDPVAQMHLDRAVAHYQARQYDLAIAEFKKGYEIEPRPEFLFAWAQSERLRGNCKAAVELYRKVLSQNPTDQRREIVEHHLRRCEAILPPPWYKDPVGGVLVVSGIVALGVGIPFYVASTREERAVESATTYGDVDSHLDAARNKRTVAIVGIAAGSTLVVAGVVRYLWPDRESRLPDVTVTATGDSAGLSLIGRF